MSRTATECMSRLRSLQLTRHVSSMPVLSSSGSPVAEGNGFLEMREYGLKPEGIKDFMSVTQEFVEVRKQLLPFLGEKAAQTAGGCTLPIGL